MDWKAASEQQQEALWRVFLMFVAMAVLVIRTGLVARGAITVLPVANASQNATSAIRDQPCSTSPADLNRATLVLLCLAEAVGRLLILKERAVWELMNQPLPLPGRGGPLSAASLCKHPAERLDTS